MKMARESVVVGKEITGRESNVGREVTVINDNSIYI